MYLKPSRAFYNGAFSQFCFFFLQNCKKTPALESHFKKVTGLYPETSLKERTPTQVFGCGFCEMLKTPLLQNTPRRPLVFYRKKYFINKIVKKPLRKGEKMETACKKNNLITLYTKSSYPFTIQKCLYFSFLCFL